MSDCTHNCGSCAGGCGSAQNGEKPRDFLNDIKKFVKESETDEISDFFYKVGKEMEQYLNDGE